MNKRIKFRLIGAGVLSAVFAFSVAGTASFEHLTPALGAARWLDAAALKTAAGLTWPADPKDPKSVNVTLYAGTPGVVLFYLEARAAAKSRGFAVSLVEGLALKAKGGADELLARPDDEMGTGLYEGIAGVGFVLEEAFKATGDTAADGEKLSWIQAEHRTQPKLLVAQTGLMQGAAGIGMMFLRWDAHEGGRATLIRMPDSAFFDPQ